MLKIRYSTKFKKDYNTVLKRGYNPALLQQVLTLLANETELPKNNKDHALSGNWAEFRECHIAPDWLLIYQIERDILTLSLTRTGSHSDLF